MAYRVKAYTLREESTESGTRYFISFKDGQGKSHELEVSEQFFMEFRRRRTEGCRCMGTKTFAVFEGIPQIAISEYAYKRQAEWLFG